MCTVLLPPGGYPIAVNIYIIYHILCHIISYIISYIILNHIIGGMITIDIGNAEVHHKSHAHVFYVTWCLILSLMLQWSHPGRSRRDLWSRSDADISQVLSRSSGVAVPSRSAQSSAPVGSLWKRFPWLCKGVRRLLWRPHLRGRPSFSAASVSSTAGRYFSAAGQMFPES